MEILKRLEQQAELVREISLELKSERSYRGVERLVQLTIQSLLDLGLMVLSAMGVSPTGYRDVANLLGRLDLLTSVDVELMRSMAGLRNVLVHGYVGVNREIVVESSRKLHGDAVRLADKILSSARRVVEDPPRSVDKLTEVLKEVLKGRVRLAFLFGSQVKGYSLKGDVDVALYFGRHPDPYEVGGLISEIQEALGREDVDVIVIDICDNISLAYEAVQGKPILGDEAEVVHLKAEITSRYIDYRENLTRFKALLAKG